MIKKTKKIPVKGFPIKKELTPLEKKEILDKAKAKKLALLNKIKENKKKAKDKHKRLVKKSIITNKKLWDMVSKTIRTGFERKCYACGKVNFQDTEEKKEALHCCHFISRTKNSTFVDPSNLLPGCLSCNMYTPHHVWNLGKHLNYFWGDHKTEELLELSKKQMKMSASSRKELYDLYNKYYILFLETSNVEKREELIRTLYEEYLLITKPLLLNLNETSGMDI